MHGIFGFCDIRKFTGITEVLREDVMLFVNHVAQVLLPPPSPPPLLPRYQVPLPLLLSVSAISRVAQIVHDAAMRTGGAPNKNIGDAFLLVWKLDAPPPIDSDTQQQQLLQPRRGASGGSDGGASSACNSSSSSLAQQQSEPNGTGGLTAASHADDASGSAVGASGTLQQPQGSATAASAAPNLYDQSLRCFLEVISDIERSPQLAALCSKPQVRERFPDLKVGLGLGLHAGWAVEGAIGSRAKIDASYASMCQEGGPHSGRPRPPRTADGRWHGYNTRGCAL